MSQTFSTIAQNASEAAYPHLWRGLAGAWVPSLGVTGGTLRDVSTYSNNGTLTNMDAATDWQQAGRGWCLDLDGSNDLIATGSDLPHFDASNRTVAVWFRLDAVGSSMYLVTNETSPTFGLGLGVYVRPDRVVRCYNYNANYLVDTVAQVSAATWHFYAMSFDGTTTRAYLDGRLSNSRTGDSGTQVSGLYNFGKWNMGSFYLNGQLAGVAFWNGVKTDGQIAELYRLGPGEWLARKRRRVYSIPGPAFKAAWATRATTIAGVLR